MFQPSSISRCIRPSLFSTEMVNSWVGPRRGGVSWMGCDVAKGSQSAQGSPGPFPYAKTFRMGPFSGLAGGETRIVT